jgi:hypothetical protein
LITTTVKNSSDYDVPVVSIVDDVIFDWERSHTYAELRAETTDPRLFHQEFKPLDDGVNEAIGGGGAGVLGNIGPDRVEVLLDERGQPIWHLRLLGASRTTARLDPLGQLPTRGLVVGTTLAPSHPVKARLHVGSKLLARLIAFLQESERLAHNFAGGLVQAALNLFVHESFELWRERDVHVNLPSDRRVDAIANIVNICHKPTSARWLRCP